MKAAVRLTCISSVLIIVSSNILPKNMPSPLSCSTTDPNYNNCLKNIFKAWGTILLNGNSELGFPSINPIRMPLLALNRTLSEFVSMGLVLRNIEVYGYDNVEFEEFYHDAVKKEGEFHIKIYELFPKWDLEATGKFYNLDLKSSGLFKANLSVVNAALDYKLKKYERLGIEYYGFDEFNTRLTIDDGRIDLISDNAASQRGLDVIKRFFNENSKSVLTKIQPIYEEALHVFYKDLAEQLLSTIPANEILPD